MPDTLRAILDEVADFEAHSHERGRTVRRWELQAECFRQVWSDIRIEDGGENIVMGEISPGCRACKAGRWDCLFLSTTCNLSCDFCLTPRGLSKVAALSALSNDINALVEVYTNLEVIGIGFSGGEPFLTPDRLLHFLSMIRERRQDIYFWAYTNGLLLTENLISALAAAGLHELRFNMAATDYFHAHATKMLRHAVTSLTSVTVEIPAIPEHAGQLREALVGWSRAGVKYLNLHELIYEPGSPSETMPGAREHCRMPDGHSCEFNPDSSKLVADVIRDISTDRLALSVNFCSLASKARQMRGRRRMMSAFTLQPHEHLCNDDEAESVCYFSDTHCEFAHPATLSDSKSRASGLGVALIRRLLPLSLQDPGQWTHFEIIQEAGEP